jgi:uncharacterized Tic20 family protein
MKMETIGEKIFDIRRRKGYSQQELSGLAGINLRTLQRIEKGGNMPHADTLKKLCKILDISIEEILDYGKKEDNKLLVLFHLSALTFFFIPFGNIIIPGIIWFLKRDKISRLNESGADLLNFQISWTILLVFSFLLSTLVYYEWGAHSGKVYQPAAYIGIFLVLLNLVYTIIVGILVYKRMPYKYYYPLIKFIR